MIALKGFSKTGELLLRLGQVRKVRRRKIKEGYSKHVLKATEVAEHFHYKTFY